MLGDKIRELRTKHNLTQKELSEKLFVTAQAVSRWEKNEVEPSIKTLMEIAKIFDVSVDELIAEGQAPQQVEQTETPVASEGEQQAVESAPAEASQQNVEHIVRTVLAVCEQCNKPLFEAAEIVRTHKREDKVVLCQKCHKENEERKHKEAVAYGVRQRHKSFGWGISLGVIAVAVAIAVTVWLKLPWPVVLGAALVASLVFPFVSCLILKNNFIGDMVEEIASWGFVTFPGLIFELSLDGIVWLLTVKLAFWIIGFTLASAALAFGVSLGMLLSIFVYPFAIAKNYRSPHLTDV